MASNTLGYLYKLTTFGESHGVAIGGVIDGCEAGIELDFDAIQHQVNRRRPGGMAVGTKRNEKDEVEWLSGLFKGKTTGAPLAFLIRNRDQKPSDYKKHKDVYRPGHADYTYAQKYGIRDYRGGGRSSARTTAPWVVAGAIAEQCLTKLYPIQIVARVNAIGGIAESLLTEWPTRVSLDADAVRCADPQASGKMLLAIEQARQEGDSLGGIIACVVKGVPVGWGEPQFSKLQADLAHAMLSINAVKGFEIGLGFDSASYRGSAYQDQMSADKQGQVSSKSNRAGGVLGGISNGEDIYFKVAFKPTASIAKELDTVNSKGDNVQISTEGRHDPCVVPRAVPIVEGLTAMVLYDHYLRAKAYK